MTLPPPSWPPPQAGWGMPPRRAVLPKRRRLGWVLIGVSVLVLVVSGATVGRAMFGLMSDHESTRVPGSVSISCDAGDEWRVGPATGTSDRFGPVTVETNFSVPLEGVTVEMDGSSVPVRPMRGGSETFSFFGTTYSAVATFTCPTDGTARVSFAGPEGVRAGVFPSFGRVVRGMLTMMAAGLVATAFGAVGIVFAVRHRRSLERQGHAFGGSRHPTPG